MNKEIKQICQTIDKNAILKKVFAIAGGGDFAFNLLSLLDIDELNICDIRQMASLTVDFKIALLKKFTLSEILTLFSNHKSNNKKQVYQKIRKSLTPISKNIFDVIINNSNHANFFKCLETSGFWYKYSFRQVKHKKDYLLYLTTQEKYQFLQKRIHKINIFCGDFIDNLRLFKNDYYDLIYDSNIFDYEQYCKIAPYA